LCCFTREIIQCVKLVSKQDCQKSDLCFRSMRYFGTFDDQDQDHDEEEEENPPQKLGMHHIKTKLVGEVWRRVSTLICTHNFK